MAFIQRNNIRSISAFQFKIAEDEEGENDEIIVVGFYDEGKTRTEISLQLHEAKKFCGDLKQKISEIECAEDESDDDECEHVFNRCQYCKCKKGNRCKHKCKCEFNKCFMCGYVKKKKKPEIEDEVGEYDCGEEHVYLHGSCIHCGVDESDFKVKVVDQNKCKHNRGKFEKIIGGTIYKCHDCGMARMATKPEIKMFEKTNPANKKKK